MPSEWLIYICVYCAYKIINTEWMIDLTYFVLIRTVSIYFCNHTNNKFIIFVIFLCWKISYFSLFNCNKGGVYSQLKCVIFCNYYLMKNEQTKIIIIKKNIKW